MLHLNAWIRSILVEICFLGKSTRQLCKQLEHLHRCCQRKHNVQQIVTILFYHRVSSSGLILSRSRPSWCIKFSFKFTSSLQKGKHRWWLGVEIVSFLFISSFLFTVSSPGKNVHTPTSPLYADKKYTHQSKFNFFYLVITNKLKYGLIYTE